MSLTAIAALLSVSASSSLESNTSVLDVEPVQVSQEEYLNEDLGDPDDLDLEDDVHMDGLSDHAAEASDNRFRRSQPIGLDGIHTMNDDGEIE